MNSTVTAATFFALRESRDLASSVCRAAGMSLAALEEQEFEGGEFKLRPVSPGRRGKADGPVDRAAIRPRRRALVVG